MRSSRRRGPQGLVAVLAACGGADGTGSGAAGAGSGPGADAGSGGAPADASGGTGAGSGGGGKVLAKTGDIPEGGGKVFADQGVVVTQPASGEFKAFSAMCTHQGCAVKRYQRRGDQPPLPRQQVRRRGRERQGRSRHDPLAPASITVEGESIMLA